jgi:Tol biopolymer transport system component
MNRDGSGLVRLTDMPGHSRHPAWSPDGTRIAFDSYYRGMAEIFVMQADGSEPTRLTHCAAGVGNRQPKWSPDGTQIIYTSGCLGLSIHVMNAGGSQDRLLVNNGAMPAWSPDGRKIAFVRREDGKLEVYVMNADGLQPTRLTYSQADQLAPARSPDGKKIAFVSYRDGGDEEIYLMNADGSEQTRLTHNPGEDGDPDWEP